MLTIVITIGNLLLYFKTILKNKTLKKLLKVKD